MQYAALEEPDGFFAALDESKTVKNRVHLDLQPSGPRDEAVDRLLALGATMFEDHRRPDGTGWATLADPEGNEFCIERSAAERGRNPANRNSVGGGDGWENS